MAAIGLLKGWSKQSHHTCIYSEM